MQFSKSNQFWKMDQQQKFFNLLKKLIYFLAFKNLFKTTHFVMISHSKLVGF